MSDSFVGSVDCQPILVNLKDAIQMASATAANSLRLDHHKGDISEGKDADLVVLDQELSVKMTLVSGKIVYNALK